MGQSRRGRMLTKKRTYVASYFIFNVVFVSVLCVLFTNILFSTASYYREKLERVLVFILVIGLG